MLTPADHNRLMILPRMHLNLVLGGALEGEYLATIAGVFNIVIALAHIQGKPQRQAFFEKGQSVVFEMIKSRTLPDEGSLSVMLESFNSADHYIGIQQTVHIHRALTLVDKTIARGDAVSLNGSKPSIKDGLQSGFA